MTIETMSEKDYNLNMPEEARKLFIAAFNNEEWSWAGLAHFIFERFREPDMSELNYAMKREASKRGLTIW